MVPTVRFRPGEPTGPVTMIPDQPNADPDTWFNSVVYREG